jgi:ribosomal protein S27AE
MIDTIIKTIIFFVGWIIFTVLLAFPITSYLSCGIMRPFKEVWIDEQKHNLRVLRRIFINDLTKCPACGSISVEHVPGQWYHCLKCSYLKYDKEVNDDSGT